MRARGRESASSQPRTCRPAGMKAQGLGLWAPLAPHRRARALLLVKEALFVAVAMARSAPAAAGANDPRVGPVVAAAGACVGIAVGRRHGVDRRTGIVTVVVKGRS